jgi:hypothetical protein
MRCSDSRVMEATHGWRVWRLLESIDPVLYSPYTEGAIHVQRCWVGKTFEAACVQVADHVPPARKCECGGYAFSDVRPALVIGCYRILAAANTGQPPPTLVLGRVLLRNAVPFASVIAGADELRAQSAVLEELFVPDLWAGRANHGSPTGTESR